MGVRHPRYPGSMRNYPSITGKTGTFLPKTYWAGHELCFTLHDIMTQLLVSGERQSAFVTTFEFRDEADQNAFENADDVFAWLEQTRQIDERTILLVSTVFPRVLSDMLHCIYEALETSRKAKLGITYMLLRKPIQENLSLLETVVADRQQFAKSLIADPLLLRSQKMGGVEAHTKRIEKVLDVLGAANRFDARYLAQLRYDKAAADGFDGICNKAIHLFTEHKAIRTEPMNVNFIFSNWEAKLTQWSYLYSRLPYLLAYVHRLVEHVAATIMPTDPAYLHDMDRRISASILLWKEEIEPRYAHERLRLFVDETQGQLFAHCTEAAYRRPNKSDLERMAETGAYPGESEASVARRIAEFDRVAKSGIAPQIQTPSDGGLWRAIRRRLFGP